MTVITISNQGGGGYNKTQLSCILFIMLTTTCFGHCEGGPHWPKHVVISIINKVQDSFVLTYPFLS